MSGPKRARARELPGKVRQGFDLALKQLASGELGAVITLADLWAEMLLTDPLRAMETLARYCPREMMIEIDSTVKVISGEPVSADEWERDSLLGEAIEIDGDDDDDGDGGVDDDGGGA